GFGVFIGSSPAVAAATATFCFRLSTFGYSLVVRGLFPLLGMRHAKRSKGGAAFLFFLDARRGTIRHHVLRPGGSCSVGLGRRIDYDRRRIYHLARYRFAANAC